ncbi:hypothetical protein acdb102_33800 [Acidothermaceae bacterium B102]|nr:hypothetical protein acdb102_33800 [Acidothermaceae bacterium B102]
MVSGRVTPTASAVGAVPSKTLTMTPVFGTQGRLRRFGGVKETSGFAGRRQESIRIRPLQRQGSVKNPWRAGIPGDSRAMEDFVFVLVTLAVFTVLGLVARGMDRL